MSKRTRSKRLPFLYVFVLLSVTWVDLRGCVVDDRRGQDDYRRPGGESVYQGVHSCYCWEAVVQSRGLEFNYMLSRVENEREKNSHSIGM